MPLQVNCHAQSWQNHISDNLSGSAGAPNTASLLGILPPKVLIQRTGPTRKRKYWIKIHDDWMFTQYWFIDYILFYIEVLFENIHRDVTVAEEDYFRSLYKWDFYRVTPALTLEFGLHGLILYMFICIYCIYVFVASCIRRVRAFISSQWLPFILNALTDCATAADKSPWDVPIQLD